MQRRRRWPIAEKIRLVEETMQPGMSVSYLARASRRPSQLLPWSRGHQALQLAPPSFQVTDTVLADDIFVSLDRLRAASAFVAGASLPVSGSLDLIVFA